MTTRIVRRPLPEALPELPADLHPVLRRIYASRHVSSARELERGLAHLLPPAALSGLGQALELLTTALEQDWRIVVIGDFDADGATSTALALRALRLMGGRQVDFLVPNRFQFGYGLTPEIVAVARERRPDLIVTVDNGISSLAGVQAAQAAGIRVLVTDHHLPGAKLPPADAIVNPNQPGDVFASKNLAGVGVIFYVMLALRGYLRERGWFAARGIEEPNLGQLLDLVALGTVADVVTLDHNNRILVAQGLARIRAGQACAGVRALAEVAGRDPARLATADLGFLLGPRLNAAGRLEDMSLGIACLLADDMATARAHAQRLDQLNRERRAIEGQMQAQALAILDAMSLDASALPWGLCLFEPSWHQGVIGILASRIKDRVHRPVIAFANADQGEIKGSARSVSGVHIRDVLDTVATTHPGLLSKFGGHAMAAGLTLKAENLAAFSAAFDAEVRRHLTADDLYGCVPSDGELGPQELNLELAESLRAAGPWGQGFPEPVFDGRFLVLGRRVVGERHLKLSLKHPLGGAGVDAIAFNTSDQDWPETVKAVDLAYQLDVNEYQGNRSLQLLVRHLQTAD